MFADFTIDINDMVVNMLIPTQLLLPKFVPNGLDSNIDAGDIGKTDCTDQKCHADKESCNQTSAEK